MRGGHTWTTSIGKTEAMFLSCFLLVANEFTTFTYDLARASRYLHWGKRRDYNIGMGGGGETRWGTGGYQNAGKINIIFLHVVQGHAIGGLTGPGR